MGCWSFGGGSYWGGVDQTDVDSVVHRAVDLGCNFFDTAEAYNDGASEESLGKAIAGLPRDRILIATKVCPNHTDPPALLAHCHASLRRLRTDYIDLYMLHWPISAHSIRHFTAAEIPTPSVADAFTTLQDLQRSGKIRHIGVANFGVAKLEEARATGARIAANQLPYSLLTRAIEHEVIPYCGKNDIAVIGYMALMQGVLARDYATIDEIPPQHRRTRHFDCRQNPQCRHGLPGAEAQTTDALQSIRRIARELGIPTADLALKWAVGQPGIATTLCGSRSVEHLNRNVAAIAQPLPPHVITELNAVTADLLEVLGSSFDYYENPSNDRTR